VYIQKGDLINRFCFHRELDGRSYAVNVTEELLKTFGTVWPYYEGVINISEPQRRSMSRRSERQFLKVLHIDDTRRWIKSKSTIRSVSLKYDICNTRIRGA
jgi:hypothetical protein